MKIEPIPKYDLVVIGAGPYGLSTAAHLKAIRGLEVKTFGEPMSFWREHMPIGMLLRSPYTGSHLSDSNQALKLNAYEADSGSQLPKNIPLDCFIDYGLWFQRRVVPDVDRREVRCIEYYGDGFRLALEDGQELKARRVVIAAGIGPFANIPVQFQGLSNTNITHTSQARDLRRFASKRVIVVGAGQSALESAALLHEGGAEVEILVREPHVHWLLRSNRLHQLGPISRMLYSPADVGPAGVSRLVGAPQWYRRLLPRALQDKFRVRSIRPAGAPWLVPRLKTVPITTGRTVTSATVVGDQVCVKLDGGDERIVDHVLLGTGYKVDITRYSFLSRGMLESLQRVNGFPRLDTNFESSVPGLYFLGGPAAWSYGPIMLFVAGADFAARTVARHIALQGRK